MSRSIPTTCNATTHYPARIRLMAPQKTVKQDTIARPAESLSTMAVRSPTCQERNTTTEYLESTTQVTLTVAKKCATSLT